VLASLWMCWMPLLLLLADIPLLMLPMLSLAATATIPVADAAQ
jgi:hypothetical protein